MIRRKTKRVGLEAEEEARKEGFCLQPRSWAGVKPRETTTVRLVGRLANLMVVLFAMRKGC